MPSSPFPLPASPSPSRPDRAPDRTPDSGEEAELQLYEAIYQAIVERRLLPGAKLPEQQLCDLFGTSRSRVRQVLARLAQERYVEHKPNRGAFVARPSPQEARDVFTARGALERWVVSHLAGTLSSSGAARLQANLRREAEAQRRGDHREATRLSGEFHLLMAELTGNRVVCELLGGLVVRSSLIIALYGGPVLHACGEDEHQRLLVALQGGDAAQAEAQLSEHLAHIVASLDLGARGERHADLRQALQR